MQGVMIARHALNASGMAINESCGRVAGRLERVIVGATQSPDFVALIASDYGCAWCSEGALAGSVSVDV